MEDATLVETLQAAAKLVGHELSEQMLAMSSDDSHRPMTKAGQWKARTLEQPTSSLRPSSFVFRPTEALWQNYVAAALPPSTILPE
jgi:hypothetical protein